MCLPSPYRSKALVPDSGNPEELTLGSGLADLEATREEVVGEVLKAPFRRVDNEIQRLSDSLHVLHMHCRVLDEMVRTYRSHLWSFRASTFGAFALSCALSGGTLFALPLEMGIGASAFSSLAFFGIYWFQSKALEDEARNIVSEGSVQSTYKRLYSKSLAESDEFISSTWPRVYQHISLTIRAQDLIGLPRVSSSDYNLIAKILDSDIAKLRKRIMPKF